jgi:arabinan endo-1,5-alpha-L-arabinosidase
MARRLAILLVTATGCGSCDDPSPAVDAAVVDPDAESEPIDAARPIDAGVDPPTGLLPLTGATVPAHDPSIIWSGSAYYVFTTGNGLPVLRSPDLLAWSTVAAVFASKPSWITTTSPGNPNLLWAPDISFFGGEYHLYYSASTFGSQDSCIGHATTLSLEVPAWEDRGSAVICSSDADPFNAIDPALVLDEDGQPWLAFGSFWEGLHMIPLDEDGDRTGAELYRLATRANTAVEAAFIIHRDGYYYLFESVDFCCQGSNSTYKQMVGRSTSITGPYVDRGGTPLLLGGGTLILQGDDRWKGPGHNAVLATEFGHINVYHSYDSQAGGAPTLRIAVLEWDDDGWPMSPGP